MFAGTDLKASDLVPKAKGINNMQHVRSTIEELRRYIATCEAHDDLLEVDTLLAVALEEVRRKIQQAENRQRKPSAEIE